MNQLLMDLYELTMSSVYLKYKQNTLATFDLFIRKKPKQRSFFVFAGLQDVLAYLVNLKFSKEDVRYLKSLNLFPPEFLEYLRDFRFTGDVWAMPEGTVFFPEEPVIRVTAPIIEAQIIETALLNIVNLQTTLATKAARVVYSAKGKPVYDFSLRRTQGEDAGLQAARCGYIAGCSGTSNVSAGKKFGIPVVGTMAHSFIMSFTSELASFRMFANMFPKNSVFLIDTYNQMDGLKNAIIVAKEMEKKGNRLSGIRLDSGNLLKDTGKMRKILDKEGLRYIKIFASGNLDEYQICDLLEKGARIDSFGVGTHMGTSSDIPYSDVIYKISAVTDNIGRFLPIMKLSSRKKTFPGLKKVYRRFGSDGKFKEDILAMEREIIRNSKPLHIKVMEKGKLIHKLPSLEDVKRYCMKNLSILPGKYKGIVEAEDYPVIVSDGIKDLTKKVETDILLKKSTKDIPPVIFMEIDTQYDFIRKNGRLAVPGAEEIIGNLKRITEFADKNNIFVVASMDKHSKRDPEFRQFPMHCVAGTKGQRKIPETRLKKTFNMTFVKKISDRQLWKMIDNMSSIIFEKNKLSIFTNPNTGYLLRSVMHVFLYGVATEYCVRAAASGLRDMGIDVTIVKDAIRAVDTKAGRRALKELKERGVEFISTDELVAKDVLCDF